jgi:hypothetical protein
MQPLIKLLLLLVIGVLAGCLVYFLLLNPATPRTQEPTGAGTDILNINNATKPGSAYLANLTVVPAPDCAQCLQGQDLLDGMAGIFNQSTVLSVGSKTIYDTSSPEGKALIAKYKITKLPAIVVSGGTHDTALADEWKNSIGTAESDGSLVSRELPPPYYDVTAGRPIGIVKGIAIRPYGCPECSNPSDFFASLTNYGIAFSNTTVLDENDTQAQELIKRYNLTKLPALLLDNEALAYPSFANSTTMGTIESDGWFVLRAIRPPYVDLGQNRSIRGFVDAIHLVDGSCTDCVDITSLTNYFATSLGVFMVNTTAYDVNSTQGKALIKKYNITKVPTVLYSPEFGVYPGFTKVWLQQNNTIESDGWFVFEAYDLAGYKYQNITGG